MRVIGIDHCIATGLGFTEGPLWTRRGRLMAVGLSRGVVHELRPGNQPGNWQVERSITTGGRPNGLAEGAGGEIWVTQAGDAGLPPAIQRICGDAVRDFPADFHAPNDLAFGPDGLLWFTDPCGHALDRDAQPGRIWTLDTQSGQFTLRAEGARYPNGLAFSPGRDALFVAETATRRLLRYPYADGELRAPEIFATLADGQPDGIAFDGEGRLHVAATTAGSVQVFDAGGVLVEMLTLPAGGFATNVCFGGDDLHTLFVTSAKGGAIFALRRDVPGAPLLFPHHR